MDGDLARPVDYVRRVITTNRSNRASQLAVGQTKTEVIAALGQPVLTSFRGNAGSFCYGSGASALWIVTTLAYKHLGIGKPLSLSAFPIEVTFGDDGRVVQVRHPLPE